MAFSMLCSTLREPVIRWACISSWLPTRPTGSTMPRTRSTAYSTGVTVRILWSKGMAMLRARLRASSRSAARIGRGPGPIGTWAVARTLRRWVPEML